MMEYICHDCGHIFEQGEEKHMKSSEGYFDGEMEYTEWTCCPVCEGGYSEAIECKICGKLKPYDADDAGNEWCKKCKKSIEEEFNSFKQSLSKERLRCLIAIMEEYELC